MATLRLAWSWEHLTVATATPEYDDAVAILDRFYPLERYPQKTLYALEEILGGPS